MKIISASRRTDIPAFYSRWLRNRLEAGFCHSINPFGGQVRRVDLRPESCLAIVLWSRNPRPLLPHLRSLQGRGYAFALHMTINGYPAEIETHNPPLPAAIETLRRAAEILSPELVHWRYDPILLSDRTPPEYHLRRFEELSSALEGYTRRCTFSFVDFYGKTERNLRRVEREHGLDVSRPDHGRKRALTGALADIAARHGITLCSCCDDSLVEGRVRRSRCIDPELGRRLRPGLSLALPATPTRQDCGCVQSTDIGAYDTCVFGCTYCYATNGRDAARRRKGRHDPQDTVLWRPATMQGVELEERVHDGGRGQAPRSRAGMAAASGGRYRPTEPRSE